MRRRLRPVSPLIRAVGGVKTSTGAGGTIGLRCTSYLTTLLRWVFSHVVLIHTYSVTTEKKKLRFVFRLFFLLLCLRFRYFIFNWFQSQRSTPLSLCRRT